MKLPAGRLAAQLGKGLQPLYALVGDEPLLADEALTLIRERAVHEGCTERISNVADRSFDWQEFAAGLRNLSLFSSRRLFELRLPTGKPGTAGAEFITRLAAEPDTGNVVVFLLPALDFQTSRSKWASALAAAATWVELKPPGRDELPGWLERRLARAGLTADPDAIDLLASRVEGNLLAARQEIDKLALLTGGSRVNAQAVRESVADGARFDVAQLCEAALLGDAPRVVRVVRGLEREGEGAVLLLWSLSRDIVTLADVLERTAQGERLEQALEHARVWRSRQGQFQRAARGRGRADARHLVQVAAHAEQVVKGVRPGDPWKALLELGLALAGAQLALAETG